MKDHTRLYYELVADGTAMGDAVAVVTEAVSLDGTLASENRVLEAITPLVRNRTYGEAARAVAGVVQLSILAGVLVDELARERGEEPHAILQRFGLAAQRKAKEARSGGGVPR